MAKLLDAVTAVGATLKSVGEKVGDGSLSTSILSDIRSNFEETFEIRFIKAQIAPSDFSNNLIMHHHKSLIKQLIYLFGELREF